LPKVIRFTLDRLPYVGALREQVRDAGSFPAEHFYSPIPARAEVTARLQSEKANNGPGINLNTERQLEVLQTFQAFYSDLPFLKRDPRIHDTTLGKAISAMPTRSSFTAFLGTCSPEES
jgi:hypothetical protein